MINISEILQSSGWKNFMAKLYGLGAAVVIVGALFKIMHWPGAGAMLTVGLSVEAIIFFFSAFEPIHEEVDWTLVYPELAGMVDEEEISKYKSHGGGHGGGSRAAASSSYAGSDAALAKFDQMIEQAEITPELFKNLGSGLQKLNDTSSKITDITDATAATNDYISNMKAASSSLGDLTDSYNKTNNDLGDSVEQLSTSYKKIANSIEDSGSNVAKKIEESGNNLAININQTEEGISSAYSKISDAMNLSANKISSSNSSYGDHLDNLNKNMSALNAVYELQLQNNNDQMKNNEELYKGFSLMMENLQSSVEETQKYKEEISNLHKNLSSLNSVYGNMLSAMHVNATK